MWFSPATRIIFAMTDEAAKRRVLSNMLALRLSGSGLANVVTGTWPSDSEDCEVIVSISPFDESTAEKVRAVMPDAVVQVRPGERPRRLRRS